MNNNLKLIYFKELRRKRTDNVKTHSYKYIMRQIIRVIKYEFRNNEILEPGGENINKSLIRYGPRVINRMNVSVSFFK